ncbi:MAG: isoprenylcysteine carboxylmethyltransferase family protein [Synergistaceae bacterium]|nr:isoprenylcysteine carboxylmethyltransferase family protein [Synergistaceae bacterium]
MNDLRATVFKLRGGLWAALFLLVLLVASPTSPAFQAVGLTLVFLGQALRLWAAGCITRYRGEKVGAQKLATWGPYAIVRNPLYVGNWLIGAGWGLLAGWTALVVFVVSFWLVYCVAIVPFEEEFLSQTFGEEYARYAVRTGRFIPRSLVIEDLFGPFDISVLWRSEVHSLLVTLIGTAVLLWHVR